MKRKTFRRRLKRHVFAFCRSMVTRKHLERDAVITLVTILLAFASLRFSELRDTSSERSSDRASEPTVIRAMFEDEVASEVQAIQAPFDTSNWKRYANPYYGFELRYPSDWPAPENVLAPKGSKWEYRFRFRRLAADGLFVGFDVVIYDVAKARELSGTDEYPKFKDGTLAADPACGNIEGHAVDTGDYPASEIYIPPANGCYKPTLFFTMIRDRYIYDIVPVVTDGVVTDADPRVSVNNDFPELYPVAGSVLLTDIVRPETPKPKPTLPKITAPHPVSFTVVNGRLVCAKKNDHPSKSKQHKGRHLDMECCLDPDEYPNPWCSYDPGEYGKYL